MIIKCGKLIMSNGIEENKYITISGDKISSIDDKINNQGSHEIIDYSNKIVGPGLVDIHCHGALNSDFADGDIEGVSKAVNYHLQKGTTTLLATIGSCLTDEMDQAMKTVVELKKKMPSLFGVHLEGPYFSKDAYGCHLCEAIRNPEKSEWIKFENYKEIIKMVTIAPELPGAKEFIEFYKKTGTIFSVGHSTASYEEIVSSIESGITHSCHIFCAQTKASRKNYILEPGLLESTLMLEELTSEIICDGIHVGPRLVEFVCKVKGIENNALVSDSLRGVGCPPGEYAFGPKNGQICKMIESPRVGIVPNAGTKLASSAIVLSDGLKIYSELTNLALEDIWKMASTVPARILGISDETGAIKEGLNADLLVMNDDLTILDVYTKGEKYDK